jgi:hypothetical protein
MFKKITFLAISLSGLVSFSQEIVSSFPLELKKNKTVFQIVNDSSKEVHFFINDNERIKTIRVDSEMKILDSLTTTRIEPDTYNHIIGYTNKSSNSSLVWASSNGKKFLIQHFDFETKKITTAFQAFDFKEEKLLQKFSDKDNFYLMSVIKNSNTMKLYIFDEIGNHKEKLIDFSRFKILNSKNTVSNLYDIFSEQLDLNESQFTIQQITNESQNSLVEGSKRKKFYIKNHNLIVSIDNSVNFTQLFTINLETYEISQNSIIKPYLAGDPSSQLSNSYLIDDKLFVIKSSYTNLFFSILDLNGSILNSFNIDQNTKLIAFTNSEVIQELIKSTTKRTLEKPEQLIRKMYNLYPGVVCYKLKNNYLVSVGSVSQLQQQVNGAMILGGTFGLIGAIGGSLIDAANPVIQNINPYANRKVVYVNCLFDKEGKHIEGEVPTLAFDKIRTFFEKNKGISSQTMFRLDTAYYLGCYENDTKQYTIRKFED